MKLSFSWLLAPLAHHFLERGYGAGAGVELAFFEFLDVFVSLLRSHFHLDQSPLLISNVIDVNHREINLRDVT